MSVSFDVRADVAQVRKMFAKLGPGVDKATARAINKTAVSVRAKAASEVQKHRNIKISEIKNALSLQRATSKARHVRLVATITARGRPIPIRLFGARLTRFGVTVLIRKGGRRQRLVRRGIRSFNRPGFAGGNVFVRESKKRLPISKWPPVPGIPTVFLQKKVVDVMQRQSASVFRRRFNEEIRYEIRRLARGTAGGASLFGHQ